MFSHDKLKLRAIDEIGYMRHWLNRIEQHVNEEDRCVEASNVLSLGESFAKLSYGVGMINNLRLREREQRRSREENKHGV